MNSDFSALYPSPNCCEEIFNDFLCNLPSVERIWGRRGGGGGGVGVLLGILGVGVLPGSPNPNPIGKPKNVAIGIFIFLSYSFGTETINTFIDSRSSLENYTRFQTEMGKICTRFQTKRAQKPHPLGRHIPIWLVKGSIPPLPSGGKEHRRSIFWKNLDFALCKGIQHSLVLIRRPGFWIP